MKHFAIKEHHLYDKAYKKGTHAGGRLVSVYVLPDYAARRLMLANPMHAYINRVGLSVTKKLGGAVQRNRAKRVIRAGLQQVEAAVTLRRGKLIVISARPAIVDAKSTEVGQELMRCFRKLDMIDAGKS